MLKLRKGHLRSTIKEGWLDNLDCYFSENADDRQLYVLKFFLFLETNFIDCSILHKKGKGMKFVIALLYPDGLLSTEHS